MPACSVVWFNPSCIRLTLMHTCGNCTLAQPSPHADGCYCLDQPNLPPDVAVMITSGSCSSAGECPQFPYQACSQPQILRLLGNTEVQPDIICTSCSTWWQVCSLAWPGPPSYWPVPSPRSHAHQWKQKSSKGVSEGLLPGAPSAPGLTRVSGCYASV